MLIDGRDGGDVSIGALPAGAVLAGAVSADAGFTESVVLPAGSGVAAGADAGAVFAGTASADTVSIGAVSASTASAASVSSASGSGSGLFSSPLCTPLVRALTTLKMELARAAEPLTRPSVVWSICSSIAFSCLSTSSCFWAALSIDPRTASARPASRPAIASAA